MTNHDTMGRSAKMLSIGLLFAIMCFGLIITGFAQMLLPHANMRAFYLWGATVQDVLCFIFPAVIVARMLCGKNSLQALSLRGCGWRPIAGALLIYIAFIPALNMITAWNASMHLPSGMSGVENWFRKMEDAAAAVSDTILATSSIGGLLSGILVIGALAAFSEEIFFRGALQRMLDGTFLSRGKAFYKVEQWGIYVSALVFSIMHLQMFGFVPRFLLGVYFGYLLVWSRSIWPGVLAHFLNNSIVVALSWCVARGYVSQAFTEVGTPGHQPWLAAISAGVGVIMIFCLKKYFFERREEAE